jgi:hypothetical protein
MRFLTIWAIASLGIPLKSMGLANLPFDNNRMVFLIHAAERTQRHDQMLIAQYSRSSDELSERGNQNHFMRSNDATCPDYLDH